MILTINAPLSIAFPGGMFVMEIGNALEAWRRRTVQEYLALANICASNLQSASIYLIYLMVNLIAHCMMMSILKI